jgi:hypothetical protein
MIYDSAFTKQHKHWHPTCFVMFSELLWNVEKNVSKWKGGKLSFIEYVTQQ